MRRILLTVLATLMVSLASAQTAKKPNIIIILADDLGWGDVGFHGSKIMTPNIDQLAKEGVKLNRYYTAPICSPTRAGLMTGRYPNRFGIRETTIPPSSNFGLDTLEEMLPQMLAKAGYKNRAIIGKWHLGHGSLKYHPMNRGFTHFYGHYNGAIDYFTLKREGERDWHNDFETSKDQGYSTDLIAADAVKSIGKYAKDKAPFFMYVAFNAPHGPFQAKKEDLLLYGYDENKPKFGNDKGEGKGNTIPQTYSAMVTCMDRGVGSILKALKDQGIDDNTIVLFHSDNGAAGGGKSGSSGELKGYKFQEWEGGVRSPAVIRWPAGFKGGRTVNQVMGYVDVMPTIKEIVGLKAPNARPFDGISVWSSIKDEKHFIDRNLYLGHGSIVNNQFKLIRAKAGNPAMKLTEDQLFKIPADFKEDNNVKVENAAVYKTLTEAVKPFDAITAKEQIDRHGNEKGFKAPKDWVIH